MANRTQSMAELLQNYLWGYYSPEPLDERSKADHEKVQRFLGEFDNHTYLGKIDGISDALADRFSAGYLISRLESRLDHAGRHSSDDHIANKLVYIIESGLPAPSGNGTGQVHGVLAPENFKYALRVLASYLSTIGKSPEEIAYICSGYAGRFNDQKSGWTIKAINPVINGEVHALALDSPPGSARVHPVARRV